MFSKFSSFPFFGSKAARKSAERSRKRRQPHRRDAGRRLFVESLEDRRLLASFSISSSSLTHNEDGSAAFTFAIAKAWTGLDGSGWVEYSVTGNGASPASGADFGGTFPTNVRESFTILQGSRTITLNVTNDALIEGNEGFLVTLTNASGGDSIGSPSTADGTIQDNDTAAVSIAAGTTGVTEGGPTANVPVTLTLTANGTVGAGALAKTVTANLPGNTEYSSAAASFTSGATSGATSNIVVSAIQDTVVEPLESFPDQALSATGATASGSCTIEVTDDDTLLVEFDRATDADAEDVGDNLPQLLVTGEVQEGHAVTIDVSALGTSTATGGGVDYADPTTLTVPAGSYTATPFAIPDLAVVADTLIEPNETIGLGEITGSQITVGDQDTTAYTIEDDDTLLVEFNRETDSDLEAVGGNLPQLLVTGDVQTDHTVTIDVSALGTSTAAGGGEDYANPTTLTVPAGSYTATAFAIPDFAVVDDALIEPDETIDLGDITGSQITVGDADEDTFTRDATGYTILDDDTLLVEFDRAMDGDAEAGGGNLPQIVVTGEIQEGHTVTIDVIAQATSTATGGGVDYDDPTTVTVGEGTHVAAVMAIPGFAILNEGLVEADETIDFGLEGSQITLGTQATTSYVIENDDDAVFFFTPFPQAVEGQPVAFVINLSHPVDVATSVTVTTFDSTGKEGDGDYTPLTDFVATFDPEVTQVTVNVPSTDDNKVEADELFNLQMVGLDNGGRDVAILQPGDFVAGKIINDDDAAVTVTGLTPDEGNNGAMVPLELFEISLTDPVKGPMTADKPVTVTISTAAGTAAAGTDYEDVTQTVTFAPGESTKTIEVPVNGDPLVEADETVDGTLSALVSPYPTTVTLAAAPTGAGTIVNDDAATLTVSNVSQSEGHAGTVTYTFDVTLSGDVDSPFSVDVRTQDGTALAIDNDYVENEATLNFAGTANETHTFTVTVNGDVKVEADEIFGVVLSNLTGLDPTAADDMALVAGTGTIVNDDAAVFEVQRNINVAEGGIATFTVILTNPVDVATSVIVSTRDGTALTADADYTPLAPLVVVFDPGDVLRTFDVQTTADDKVERDETFDLFLTGLDDGGRAVTISPTKDFATAKILNDDAAVVSIDSVEQDEDAGEMEFTVSLSQEVDVAVSVTVSTADDAATTGDSDYTAKSQVVTFAPGELTKTFTVAVTEDIKVEADETLTVGLSGLSAGGRSVTISATEGTGTILNDDDAEFSIDSVAQAEDSGALVFTVTLSAPVDVPVSVTATTAEDAATEDEDYTGKTEVLTFAAGELTKTFTVEVTADDTVEDDEIFHVDLSDLDDGGRNVAISGDAGSGTGTIVNDDLALFSIDSVSKEEGDEGTTEFTFTVTLSHPCAVPVSIDYATADGTAEDGSDYEGTSGTLTFEPGGELTQTITVQVQGDTTVENDETFTVTLSNPLYGEEEDDSRVDLDAEASVGTGTIENDDTATLSVTSPTITEGDDGTQTLTFDVTVDLAVAGGFTVAFSVADDSATAGTDYTVITVSPLEFEGLANETLTIEVTIHGDLLVEADETFTVTLEAVTAATAVQTAAVTSGAEGTGTIENDDSAEVRIGGNVDVAEGSGAVFTVFLTQPVDVETIVTVTTDDDRATVADNDYSPLDGFVVTFPAGSTEQTFTVATTADNKVELNETFIATLVGSNAGGRDVTIPLATSFATARILNDDSAVVSIAGVEWPEGNSEAAAPLGLFVISLTNPVDVALTVEFSTQDDTATQPDDYTAQTAVVVTIPANTVSVTHSVDVVGDLTVEPDETVGGSVANLAPGGRSVSLGTSTATATILNDDNTPPVATDETADADEDGDAVVIPTGTDDADSDDDSTTLEYTIVTPPAEGSVTSNGDGSFTFDPGDDFQDLAADETRDVTFVYMATDSHDADSNEATVTITVMGANDAPAVENVSLTVYGDDTLTFVPADIAGQFSDVDGDDPVMLKLVDLPLHGTLLLKLIGNPIPQPVTVPDSEIPLAQVETLTYDPAEHFFGPDSFTWTASDGIVYAADVATVSISVINTTADIVGCSPAGQWWVAKSTGANFVNELWGTWSTIAWLDVRVADVNGDGRADIVGRTEWGDWWVAKANETGTEFVNQLWGHWDPVAWQDVAVGDVNGDGRADIVGRSPAGQWWVAKANETGTGSVNQLWGTWSPIAWLDVHVADVSGDGRADIVGRTESGDWWVAKTNETGTESVNELWGHWDPVAWHDVAVGDVNGDGRADIVGRTDAGVWYVAKANETGMGFDTALWGVWSPITWHDVHVADVNSDGRADIVGRTDDGVWYVAKANETGTHSTNHPWGVWSPITWLDVQVADVSGDGRADIVGRTDAGQWWVAKTNDTGTGSVNELWGYWSPAAWSDVHAADVTGKDALPLHAAGAAPSNPAAAESLSQAELLLAVGQAIQHWNAAGLAAAQLAALEHVQVAIADLPGLQLGLATAGAIVLDVNAAGYGWDVAAGPQDLGPTAAQMDLLTAVLHELGHAAGLADEYGDPDNGDVMSGWLLPGTRRLPTLADVDAVFGGSDGIAD